jgi:hypothetical protein
MAEELLSHDEQVRRDAILEAIAFAAQRWLETPKWTDANDDVLAALGRATGASRSYLFRNAVAADGELRTDIIAEWCAPDVSP